MLSVKDYETLNLLDSLPQRLPTNRIVAILNSPRPRRDMLALMASHKGVGAGQKSRFQLLREKVNAHKKNEDALISSSSGAAGRNSEGKRRGRRLPRKRSRVSKDASYTRLMGTEIQIYDGMSITISQQEADIITNSPLPTLMKAFAEYQSRVKSWKNHCLETKEKGKKSLEEVEELKITNAELDKELWELRENVIEEHELGFKKALRIFPLVLNMPRIPPLGKVAKVVVQMGMREETSLLA
ncbi:hypothetical protein DEO72_LG7g1121 [Vigna unguiculata]|uniref:Uncharacterized protein n=1 Tax=Vigna unguiculata TaxID=3917 RepID=A0A4D6MEP7_VIGUN|nr:hypothetical protein DEO72_LG7g1121 [Vigna unguiculata]